MPDRIELEAGASPWLRHLQLLTCCLAAISLLAVSTPWQWKLSALLVLSFVHFYSSRHTARYHAPSDLLLRLDGSMRERQGALEFNGTLDGAWVSRWLCLIHWTAIEKGRQRHSLVCASNNRPENFRRLRVYLRLGVHHAPGVLT